MAFYYFILLNYRMDRKCPHSWLLFCCLSFILRYENRQIYKMQFLAEEPVTSIILFRARSRIEICYWSSAVENSFETFVSSKLLFVVSRHRLNRTVRFRCSFSHAWLQKNTIKNYKKTVYKAPFLFVIKHLPLFWTKKDNIW